MVLYFVTLLGKCAFSEMSWNAVDFSPTRRLTAYGLVEKAFVLHVLGLVTIHTEIFLKAG